MALLVYFVIVARGNYVHEYYQLPFMIPAVVFMGKVYARYGSPKIWKNRKSLILTVGLVGVLVLSMARYSSYMKLEDPQSSEIFKLAEKVKQKIPENSFVICVTGIDPTLLYLSHRKGWHVWGEELEENYLEGKIRQGAKFLVGFYRHFDETQQDKIKALFGQHQVLWDQEGSFIVELRD